MRKLGQFAYRRRRGLTLVAGLVAVVSVLGGRDGLRQRQAVRLPGPGIAELTRVHGASGRHRPAADSRGGDPGQVALGRSLRRSAPGSDTAARTVTGIRRLVTPLSDPAARLDERPRGPAARLHLRRRRRHLRCRGDCQRPLRGGFRGQGRRRGGHGRRADQDHAGRPAADRAVRAAPAAAALAARIPRTCGGPPARGRRSALDPDQPLPAERAHAAGRHRHLRHQHRHRTRPGACDRLQPVSRHPLQRRAQDEGHDRGDAGGDHRRDRADDRLQRADGGGLAGLAMHLSAAIPLLDRDRRGPCRAHVRGGMPAFPAGPPGAARDEGERPGAAGAAGDPQSAGDGSHSPGSCSAIPSASPSSRSPSWWSPDCRSCGSS